MENKTIINLKFKRTITGEYTTTYEGYGVEINKEYETGKWYEQNWLLTIRNLNTGAIEHSDIANCYRTAKEKVKDIFQKHFLNDFTYGYETN